MGEHIGWRVTRRGDAWRGWAWDPGYSAYKIKSFAREPEAKKWAKDMHSAYLLQQEQLAPVTTVDQVKVYCDELTRLGRSAVHLNDVGHVLRRFARAVPNLANQRAVDHTRAWLSTLKELSPATRNRYLRTVKALAKWLVNERQLVRNPLVAVRFEKEPDFLKPQFTIDELQKLTRAFEDPYHLRWCCMIYAGARREEAVSLTAADFDFAGRTVTLTGKGQKMRQAPMPIELEHVLRFYGVDRAQDKLFPKPAANLHREFLAFLRRQDVPTAGRSPHSTRHCYAGLMTATGVPTLRVAEVLGHESMDTTRGYAKFAARYERIAGAWKRWEFELLTGWASCLGHPAGAPN